MVLKAIKHFKSPIKRLLLDSTPLGVFERLYEDIAGNVDDDMGEISRALSHASVVNYFEEAFTNVHDLHLVIVVDSVGCSYSLKRSYSAFPHILTLLKPLKSLSIVWSDRTGDLGPSQESSYLRN
jgi:hypothetical protein